MCYGCYEEAGKSAIVNEKTKKAAKLINDIYEQEDCGAGGYAHTVVDDWNLEDSNTDFCINAANVGEYDISEDGRLACLNCLNYLKELSIDERYSAMAIHSKFIRLENNIFPH